MAHWVMLFYDSFEFYENFRILHTLQANSGRLKVVPVHPLACRSNKKEYNIKETGSSSSEIHIT